MALALEKVYVTAPPGFITNETPEQIEPLFTEMVGLGETKTLLKTLPLFTQPLVFEPITPYEVLEIGETVKVLPLIVYALAPDGVMIKVLPWHMLPLFTEIVGVMLTNKLLIATTVLKQPAELVPVTL